MKPVTSYTEDGLKICSDCKIAKSKDCYYPNPHKWDGIANVCKTCNCKRDKLKDKEKEKVRRRLKYLKYKDREIQRDSAYKKNREELDPSFKLMRRLRDRHSKAVKASGAGKNFRTTDLLGCSAEVLRIHIESQFSIDMNWENYGKVWQVDHIHPLSLVDWNNSEEVELVCNYKNLQPLLVYENISKGNKILKLVELEK